MPLITDDEGIILDEWLELICDESVDPYFYYAGVIEDQPFPH